MREFDVWAMLPDRLVEIEAGLRRWAQGLPMTPLETRSGARSNSAGGVMVIPIVGPISQRGGGLWEQLFGGTTTEAIATALRAAVADPAVGAIVLDVDSPGGSVNGVAELADEVYAARGVKPIVAVANGLAASAAYWIAAQADELLVAPSGEVGGIGVYAAHQDVSEMLAQEGIKTTLIAAGKYKVEGNPFEPLTDEARAALQGRVDDYYTMFVNAVARGRNRSERSVRDGFGEGRVVGATTAVIEKMADRVGILETGISRAATKARARMRADVDWRARRLRSLTW